MAKKKVTLKNLGKQHIKDALVRVHPFLRIKYRLLKEDELESEDVFAELFPYAGGITKKENLKYILKAIYAFQN